MKKHLLVLSIVYSIFVTTNTFAQTFTSSNLPIVVINTYGQYIDTAYQKFIVGMGIIDNGPGVRNNLTDPYNSYNGEVEIKVHGSSSISLPKKSYAITPLDAAHNKVGAALFGLPSSKDWILKALYQDKTFLRDAMAFKIFNEMGHYSSRTLFFELVENGNYRGVYQLEEKVKRDNNRVNISKLKATDISGDDLTGGYIIKLDHIVPTDQGWFSNYYSNITHDSANFFMYEYPNPDSMAPEQKAYIKNDFDKFENVLTSPYFSSPDSGYSTLIDVPSFIDNFIINEMGRNVDGYRCSSFFYKDKDSKDSKIHCGPVWDFNLAFDNASYNGGSNTWGWQYQQYATQNYVPFWWWQLMSDNAFKNELRCRYENLRSSILSISSLNSYIDSMAIYLDESQNRNFIKWPIMGVAVYPEPSPIPPSYAGEIGNLKWWIQQRLLWMDSNLPGVCNVDIAENKPDGSSITVFPNPCTNNFNITYEIKGNKGANIELYNTLGARVMLIKNENRTAGNIQKMINMEQLPAGTYILKITSDNHSSYKKIIKIGK